MITSELEIITPYIYWAVAILIVIYYIRRFMQGGVFTNDVSASGKVVLITGANTGIGKETALELARRGAAVYMACRDMEKAEKARSEIIKETDNMKVYCRKLDLSSLKSVREFAEAFKKEEVRLDILINNAGVMFCPRSLTEDGFEQHMGVNHFGHFLLTNLLLDLIKASAPSRIINVSSKAHYYGKINVEDLNSEKSYNVLTAYGQSKLANVLFTRHLAKLLKDTEVTVYAVHPGFVDTELFRFVVFMDYAPFRWIFNIFSYPFIKTPKNGAQSTICAALDPSLHKVSGVYITDCKLKDVSKAALDDKMAEWLWKESKKLTGLKEE